MKAFRPYVARLERMAIDAAIQQKQWTRKVASTLNGEPGQELADALSLRTRRKMGAFFTGETLARQVIRPFKNTTRKPVFYDPAVGVGDLLLAAARRLPVRNSFQATLDLWETRLAGCDTNEEFVRTAKARLVLLARLRAAKDNKIDDLDLHSVFPLIQVRDGLDATNQFNTATWIVLNPPYGYTAAPKGCSWASGKLTAAAVFFEACLQHSISGTRITAILPDVLRSGTRYEDWRQMVRKLSSITRVETYGLFDRNADVDVFVLDVTKRAIAVRPRTARFNNKRIHHKTIGDFFDVHVGTVVPHRHRQQGVRIVAPYIHARAIPAWGCVQQIGETRRFRGSLFKPPFIAIRRTSRPEDTHRATGTLITGARSVAVENHLIVCRPKDKTIKRCRELLFWLKHDKVNEFLNHRIRCRHLTVTAVREIPYCRVKAKPAVEHRPVRRAAPHWLDEKPTRWWTP